MCEKKYLKDHPEVRLALFSQMLGSPAFANSEPVEEMEVVPNYDIAVQKSMDKIRAAKERLQKDKGE